MGHLKKSSTTGHLLKNSAGHLVNECVGGPFVLMPCFPIFVLEPCQGGAPICCRNDFREFAFSVEDDGHLWAQDVLIVRNGQCYRIRYCEEADGCAAPGVEAGLKIWDTVSHFPRVPANHQWQDGDCDYVEPWGPGCDTCPPKFAVGNHTCSGPGHGACTMSFGYNPTTEQWEASIDYHGTGGSTPYGQDAVFNIGICPYAGPPPGGCDDLVMKITWHDMELDDWVEPLNRPLGQKPTPPDCWYIFDGEIPYDRHVGIHGCITERWVAAEQGDVITITEPANPGDLVPCYQVYDVSETPDLEQATVYRRLLSCEDCCDE